MPELPEVEVVRAGLAPAAVGSLITAVSVFDERALTRHVAGAADFVGRLEGRTFTAASRRGKFLWLPLDDGDSALIAHLGMSGQMLLRAPDAGAERHERVRIGIEHPTHGELAIVFADQRTFGSLAVDALIDDAGSRIPTQVAHIARDPLDPRFDDPAFRAALARRASAIKRVLLDQGVVSGIGNIYADEALWRAGVHGERVAQSLSKPLIGTVLDHASDVMREALDQGGTSFDALYVNVNGASGYFDRSLAAYGQEGRPCRRCGTLIRREHFMNRSSFSCPRCQPRPRARRQPA